MFKDDSAFLADFSKAIIKIVLETPCLFLYVTYGGWWVMRGDSSLAGKGFTPGSEPALRSKKTRSCQEKRVVFSKGPATPSSLFYLFYQERKIKERC